MKFALDAETRDFAASVDEMLRRADVPAAIRAWNDGDTAAEQDRRGLPEAIGRAGQSALPMPPAEGDVRGRPGAAQR